MATLTQANLLPYHGSIEPVKWGNCPALATSPSETHHCRIVSKSLHHGLHASFMIQPITYTRPTPKNDDGIHFRYEIDNEHGYLIHLLRRDGKTKVSREDGTNEYDDITFTEGLRLVLKQIYIVDIVAKHDSMTYSVASPVGELSNSVNIPRHNKERTFRRQLPFGRFGLRLDGLRTKLTYPVISNV